ncbi:MAG: hypothetical protein ACJ71F_06900 [Nitrososphaeraceae archaeon]
MPCDNESPIKNICISPTQQTSSDTKNLQKIGVVAVAISVLDSLRLLLLSKVKL